MKLLVNNMKWIMIVSGVLTCTMLQALVAPKDALLSLFGDSIEGPLAEIIVRNWGALIGLVGAMLIYGAFRPVYRPLVLTVAGLSKLIFIGLVLNYGAPFISHQVGIAIAVDLVMVVLFIAYLLGARQSPVVD